MRTQGELRVVKSGIAATNRVVNNGLFRLRPGTPVVPSIIPKQKES